MSSLASEGPFMIHGQEFSMACAWAPEPIIRVMPLLMHERRQSNKRIT